MDGFFYLLVALFAVLCLFLPAEALSERFRRQLTDDPFLNILLALALLLLGFALFYLAVVSLPPAPRQWACRIFLGGVLASSLFILLKRPTPVVIFRHSAFRTYLLVFLVALFIPHLFKEVTYDLMPNRTHSSRVANYQSDSKIPFNVLRMFNNYDLRDRKNTLDGWPVRPPLMALVTGPFVQAIKKKIRYRSWEKDQGKWGYFTDDGFWLFRIVGTALNALVVFVPFLLGPLLRLSLPIQHRAAQFFGLGVFAVINIYFTWPKFLCCFLMAAALSLLAHKKHGLAGISFALSYLAHPLSALYLPGVLLFHFYRGVDPRTYLKDLRLYRFFGMLLVTLSPWLVYDAFVNANNIFLRYPLFEKAGTSWFWFRVQNAFNTIFPYGFSYTPNSFLWDRGLQAIPAAEAGALWLTWTNYTTTLAGALGLVFCWVAYYGLIKKFSVYQRAIVCLLLIPFFCVLGYWGFTCHGVMKEAGQPLLFVPLLLGVSLLETVRQRWLIVAAWFLEFLFFIFVINFKVEWASVSLLALGIVVGCQVILGRWFVGESGVRTP